MSGHYKSFGRNTLIRISIVLFLTFCFNSSAFDLSFLSIKKNYRIYLGDRKYLKNQLYFLPCGDSVLVISVGTTAYLGKGTYLHKKMLLKARINAQNQIERFTSSQMSASQKVNGKKGDSRFLSQTVQDFSRNLSMWELIGSGLSSDQKRFACVIGKVFPRKLFPPSILN